MCLESIHAMKDALLKLKFESDEADELAMVIPTEAQFEVLESMLVPLEEIKHASEQLSADSKPTIHKTLIFLFNLTRLSQRYPESVPEVVPFLESIRNGLEKRLPNCGREVPLVSSILNEIVQLKITSNFSIPIYNYYYTTRNNSNCHVIVLTPTDLYKHFFSVLSGKLPPSKVQRQCP
jgi:hypothetical protein